jgi:ATP-independent RNA helicase DbpA
VSITEFSSLSIKPELLANLSTLGYERMTPIQAGSLSHILEGKDVIAQAKTGSGKTAAFGIGLLNKIDTSKIKVQALILSPTRELSEQVAKELRNLARQIPNVKILSICGGVPGSPQAASLRRGAHVVVGTPGRLLDHIEKRTLDVRFIDTLVLDEADRMLEMGFADQISEIIKCAPKKRQTLLFSATFPGNIESLSKEYQQNAVRIKTDTEHSETDIEQLFFETRESEKTNLLASLLLKYRPESSLVFCNTKLKCDELAADLRQKGFSAQAIHGDLEQRERDLALILFANRSTSILVATDVAARGLDVKELQVVVNYDLSRDPEVHVHRIGRTGRAGKKGLALSLLTEIERDRINAIESYQRLKVTLERVDPSDLKKAAPLHPSMATLRLEAGKRDKIRPGDILGALTAAGGVQHENVGKIDIFDSCAYVAITCNAVKTAFSILSEGKIKGKRFRVRMVES